MERKLKISLVGASARGWLEPGGSHPGIKSAWIVDGSEFHPGFDDALAMHRLLETIQQSSEQKTVISFL